MLFNEEMLQFPRRRNESSKEMLRSHLRLPNHLSILFREFHSKELPFEAMAILLFIITIFAIVTMAAMFSGQLGRDRPRGALIKLSLVLGFPMLISGWIALYLKFLAKYRPLKCGPQVVYWASFMQGIFAIAMVIFCGMRLYAKTKYGPCVTNSVREIMYCNPNAASGGLPEDNLVALILIPILFPILLRDTDFNVVIMTWLMAIIFLSISIIHVGINSGKAAIIISYFIISGIGIYSNQLQNVRSFVIQQQLAAVIKQNEEMAEELRANELRHMIGNVAHDLKTPLASFVSGLDMVADIAQDGLRKLSSIDNFSSEEMMLYDGSHYKHLAKEVRGWLEGVLCSVQNSHNVNNFMMMTINRCIDYTKASKGLKLVPKYETVELMETLSLPFKCMKDVSQKVHVHLEELSKDICSHVITDKQWLQENILCLLSNAVKYSAGGNVNGRVSLKRVGEIGPGSVCQLPGGLMQSSCRDSDGSAKASVASGIAPRVEGENRGNSTSDMIRRNRRTTAVSALAAGSNRSTSTVSRVDENSLHLTSPRDLAEQPSIANMSSSGDLFLLVEIEDTGIGLTEEGMATLFNAFKQAQKLAGGTGLGLFSLARRVEALGGSYGVRKRLDGVQGSVFWFTIPYRPDTVTASLTELVEERVIELKSSSTDNPVDSMVVSDLSCDRLTIPSKISNDRRKMRILIVDDAPSIQKMMSMMLRRHGHHVDQADNGASGLSLVTSTHNEAQEGFPAYDVVLMDLQMPVMDGLEATRRIREAERLFCEGMLAQRKINLHSHVVSELSSKHRLRLLPRFSSSGSDKATVPTLESCMPAFNASKIHQFIIGVSANSDTDTMNEAFAAGVDAFISKPFSIDVFYQTYYQHADS